MVKYELERSLNPPSIIINLSSREEEKDLVMEKEKELIWKLRFIHSLSFDDGSVSKGVVHGFYRYRSRIICLMHEMKKTEDLIKKEAEDLGLEEFKKEDKQRGA